MEEIGGLIVDLIKNAARAKAAQARGEAAPPMSERLRVLLTGDPNEDMPKRKAPPIRVVVPPQTAPVPRAAAPKPPSPAAPPPLLADFRDPRRFLAAFVLAEALGPPVGLRSSGAPARLRPSDLPVGLRPPSELSVSLPPNEPPQGERPG